MTGGPPWRIWVIEDDDDLRQRICDTLPLDDGLEVEELDSHAAAEALLSAVAGGTCPPPHVVVLDFFLGDGTGAEVLAALRRHCPAPGPVVIAHSSVDSMNAVLVAAGAHHAVPKRRSASRLAIGRLLGSIEGVQRLWAAHCPR